MIQIYNDSTDPYFNLALEEYLLDSMPEEVFMLWRNDKAVVVGKNQNTLSEVNRPYAEANGIAVVRRLTGGGAVFHDLGNLCYTFILNDARGLFSRFEALAAPILKALAFYGVKAEFSGRNDLTIGGAKFSGNAQALYKGRLLHHGTLLFHTDFDRMSAVLNVDERKLSSKGIRSVKSRVTNIAEHADIDMDGFIDRLLSGDAGGGRRTRVSLSAADIAAARKLAEEKYASWDWNYGYSPGYSFHNAVCAAAGLVEVYLDVSKGLIKRAKFYGDFFFEKDVSDIEKALLGAKHSREGVTAALGGFDIDAYFKGVSLEEILTCLGV